MKKLFLLIACFPVLLASNAFAQDDTTPVAEAPKIAIVDVRVLMSESKAAKNIQTQVQSHREKFIDELKATEKSLIEDKTALDKQLQEEQEAKAEGKESDFSPEEFMKKAADFEKDLMKSKNDANVRRRDLEVAAGKATQKLRNNIIETVEEIADKEGYTLVLSSQSVVIGTKEFNITDQVMDALNKKVTKIKVDF